MVTTEELDARLKKLEAWAAEVSEFITLAKSLVRGVVAG